VPVYKEWHIALWPGEAWWQRRKSLVCNPGGIKLIPRVTDYQAYQAHSGSCLQLQSKYRWFSSFWPWHSFGVSEQLPKHQVSKLMLRLWMMWDVEVLKGIPMWFTQSLLNWDRFNQQPLMGHFLCVRHLGKSTQSLQELTI
jgi:hypothetical protein